MCGVQITEKMNASLVKSAIKEVNLYVFLEPGWTLLRLLPLIYLAERRY